MNCLTRCLTTAVCLRWPSVLDLPGQSLFLTPCPGKNHKSPGTPICPVFGLASRICPDLTNCSVFLSESAPVCQELMLPLRGFYHWWVINDVWTSKKMQTSTETVKNIQIFTFLVLINFHTLLVMHSHLLKTIHVHSSEKNKPKQPVNSFRPIEQHALYVCFALHAVTHNTIHSVTYAYRIKLAQILSVEAKNIDGGWGSAPDTHWESSQCSPRPLVEPKCLAPWALVPDFSDQIMVILGLPPYARLHSAAVVCQLHRVNSP